LLLEETTLSKLLLNTHRIFGSTNCWFRASHIYESQILKTPKSRKDNNILPTGY